MLNYQIEERSKHNYQNLFPSRRSFQKQNSVDAFEDQTQNNSNFKNKFNKNGLSNIKSKINRIDSEQEYHASNPYSIGLHKYQTQPKRQRHAKVDQNNQIIQNSSNVLNEYRSHVKQQQYQQNIYSTRNRTQIENYSKIGERDHKIKSSQYKQNNSIHVSFILNTNNKFNQNISQENFNNRLNNNFEDVRLFRSNNPFINSIQDSANEVNFKESYSRLQDQKDLYDNSNSKMYRNINNSSKFNGTNKKPDPVKNRGYFTKEQLTSDEQEIKNQKLLKWKQELDQQLKAKKQEEQQKFQMQKEQELKEEQKRKIQLEQIQMQYLKEQGDVQGKSQQFSSQFERSFQIPSKKRNPNVQSGDGDFQRQKLKINNDRIQIQKYNNFSEKQNNDNQQDENQIQNEEQMKHIQNDFRSQDITRINYANNSQDIELLKGLLNHQQHLFKNQLSSLRENVKQMQYNRNNAINNMGILGNKARINQLNKIYEQDNSLQLQNKLIFNTNGSSNILNPYVSSYFRNNNQNLYLQYNGLQSLQQKPLKFDQFGNLNLDEFQNSQNKDYDQNGNLLYGKTQTYFDKNDNIQVQKKKLQTLLQDNKNQDQLYNEELLANSRFYQIDEQFGDNQKLPNNKYNENEDQEQTKTQIFSENVQNEIKNEDNNFTKNNEIEISHDEKQINPKCNDIYNIKLTDENSNNCGKKNDDNCNEQEIQEQLQNQQLNQTDYSQEQQLKYIELENMNQS